MPFAGMRRAIRCRRCSWSTSSPGPTRSSTSAVHVAGRRCIESGSLGWWSIHVKCTGPGSTAVKWRGCSPPRPRIQPTKRLRGHCAWRHVQPLRVRRSRRSWRRAASSAKPPSFALCFRPCSGYPRCDKLRACGRLASFSSLRASQSCLRSREFSRARAVERRRFPMVEWIRARRTSTPA